MKHKAFRWIPAVLLAALLAGCGARAAASARPAGSRELKSTPPDSKHATAAITEPVSYTRLDVYKRQLEGIRHRLVAGHVRQPGQLGLHLLAFQLQLVHPPPGLPPVFLEPVSYTHL